MAPIIPKIFVIYQSATNCSAIKLNFLPGLTNKNHNSIRHSWPKCPYQDFLPSPVFFIMVLEALSQKFRPNDFAESVEKLRRKVTTWNINLENTGRSLRVEVKKIKSWSVVSVYHNISNETITKTILTKGFIPHFTVYCLNKLVYPIINSKLPHGLQKPLAGNSIKNNFHILFLEMRSSCNCLVINMAPIVVPPSINSCLSTNLHLNMHCF